MSKSHPDLTGRICLVTGASTGIGKVTARELARMGGTVIMVSRDPGRGQAALADVQRATGSQKVSLLLADLSSQQEVRRLAREVQDRVGALHVLVNNAGAIYARREVTVDGLERTFATNHLAYFLLTVLLLPLIKRSAPARIVNVASQAHRPAVLDLNDLQLERRYGAMRAYRQSKLANVLFTYELARRLEGSGVTANCLHPGVVATHFGRNNPGLLSFLFRLASPFLLTPEQGAETVVYLATSPKVAQVSGKYFYRCRPIRSSRLSYDETLARRLWEVSERLTALAPSA